MAPYIASRFKEYPGFAGISMSIMSSPGHGPVEDYKVCWETPLGFTVRDSEGSCIALGLEFHGGFLCVRQLQGVRGRRIARKYRHWPQILIEIAQDYAIDQGLRGVKVYRAHTSLFYWYPDFGSLEEDKDFFAMREDLRIRLRRRYDGTAREMGFVLKKKYGEWLCPP